MTGPADIEPGQSGGPPAGPSRPASVPAPTPPSPPAPVDPTRWWGRTPLLVKLVATMLLLVSLALVAIGVGSAFALRGYLVGTIDQQLDISAQNAKNNSRQLPRSCGMIPLDGPSDFFLAVRFRDYACNSLAYDDTTYLERQLPRNVPDGSDAAHELGVPYTESSADGTRRWRLLVTPVDTNRVLTIGEDLSAVDNAMDRLVAFDLLVGTVVLLTLALVGMWLVRVSLKPLVGIERTAAAIAGGDLTQRVPASDPRTELGRLSRALNTMLSQIESAFLARAASEARAVRSEERMRQFVADASHELRTPLTTIRGFAELFRQGAASEPAEVLQRIESEAARMGLLVEDLLLLARLDRERPMEFSRVALAELVGDAAEAAHAVAPERTVEVEIADPAEALVVNGDEARLRQIIGNLVTNALTHTPDGTPVALRLRADGAGQALIEVSDSGPGLMPEEAERVFERFYRVDKARTRRAYSPTRGTSTTGPLAAPHSGAGLGLAIVAALVAAHDGSVEVDSEPGAGATFRVRLPLASMSPASI